jgi:tetratricopeptide (TPR) repeat protein
VDRGKDGKTYAAWYGLRSELLAKAGKAPSSSAAPKKLTMYWDASFSREKSDHQKTFEALNAYFARYPQSVIQVSAIVFRDAPEAPRDFTVKNGRAEELLQFLASLPYDGATRFQDLPAAKGSDLAILVTDGLTTLGGPAFEAGVPVFALAVERSFDAARLAALSNASGGALLRLDNPSEAAMRIGAASFRFLGARITEGKAESIIPISATALLDASSGDLAGVIGILGSKTVKATLRFGYSESTAVEIPVTWEDTGVSSESAPKDSSQSRAVQESLWASSELARLLALPDADSGATLSKVEALGRDYNLVTPRTSLIVLESLEQYVEFRIRPPESLPGMRSEWAMAIASIDKEQIDKRKAAIENLVEEWKVRVAWWEKKFEYPANFKYKEPAAEKSAEALGPSGDERMRLADAAPASAADGFEESAEGDDKAKKDSSEGGDAGPSISIQAWNPDTPYIKKLDAARGGASGKLGEAAAKEAYAIYLTERKQNERAPGFYFDVGDWFEKAGRMDLATRIWSTLAELDLESPNLLRVLAARLVQAGRLPAAKDIYEQVAVMRPEEPHSYRDLALMLTKMGEHGTAVDLLYTVALGTYPQWPGIELIALNELNGILPKAKAAQQKTVEIDPRLVKVLDSDVRITMSWDTDLSDMDLWVIEPSGEKAYYGHQQTTIGGLVSQDITTGYGPEEYTVRKAMKGVYSIKANYYGNQNPEVSGTVTVQVEVITDWGRKTEKRQSLVLRLKGQSDVYTVGEIKF